MRRRIITLILLALTLLGLGLRFYPNVADWWNRSHQSHAVATYAEAVANLDEDKYKDFFEAADAYNARLLESGILWSMNEEQEKEYFSLLDATGLGIMAYLDIPKIGVTLPIYHGTSDTVLQVAIGHLAGTSLPVGGIGTHCSVSGHRGLASARLFTDLGQLAEGDRFTVTVLDRLLTYEVDQIHIVLPTELDDVMIDPEQDYFTLITCTPYGVNSHRLLVRGRRVENDPEEVIVLAEAVLIQPRIVAFVLAIPILLILFVWMMVSTGRKIRQNELWKTVTAQFRERRKHREELRSGKTEEKEQQSRFDENKQAENKTSSHSELTEESQNSSSL